MRNQEPQILNLVSDVLVASHVLPSATDKGKRRVLFYDCRSNYEPQTTELRRHYGTHPDILQEYHSHSCTLSNHVVQLKQKINSCSDEWYLSHLTLVVFDEHGRLGAMATAKVFAEISLRAERLKLVKVTMLTHETDVDCSMCRECSFCSRASERRNTLIKQICGMPSKGVSAEKDR